MRLPNFMSGVFHFDSTCPLLPIIFRQLWAMTDIYQSFFFMSSDGRWEVPEVMLMWHLQGPEQSDLHLRLSAHDSILRDTQPEIPWSQYMATRRLCGLQRWRIVYETEMEVDEYQAWLDAYYGYVVLPPPLPGLWLTQDWSQVSYTKSPWHTFHLSWPWRSLSICSYCSLICLRVWDRPGGLWTQWRQNSCIFKGGINEKGDVWRSLQNEFVLCGTAVKLTSWHRSTERNTALPEGVCPEPDLELALFLDGWEQSS